MTLPETIQKAYDGGYITGFMYDRLAAIDPLQAFEILLFDPTWWKCLGKALGWTPSEWLYQWHKLIDHIASGKSIESFFYNFNF